MSLNNNPFLSRIQFRHSLRWGCKTKNLIAILIVDSTKNPVMSGKQPERKREESSRAKPSLKLHHHTSSSLLLTIAHTPTHLRGYPALLSAQEREKRKLGSQANPPVTPPTSCSLLLTNTHTSTHLRGYPALPSRTTCQLLQNGCG